jgi:hypothetical protein
MNVNKCTYSIFSGSSNTKKSFTFNLNKQNIKHEKNPKFLGIIFDEKLCYDTHVEKMRYYHQRWMPSNQAKRAWSDRVRNLDIDIIAPQHGRMFKGDDVKRFLDWFDSLQVGTGI